MAEVEVAEDSARRLAEEHGLRFVDLTQAALAPGAAALLPEEVARRHRVVPIGRRLGTPVIAVSDPGDLFAMDALRASVGREFVAVVAREDQVVRALGTLYSQAEATFPDEDGDAGSGDAPDAPEGKHGEASSAETMLATAKVLAASDEETPPLLIAPNMPMHEPAVVREMPPAPPPPAAAAPSPPAAAAAPAPAVAAPSPPVAPATAPPAAAPPAASDPSATLTASASNGSHPATADPGTPEPIATDTGVPSPTTADAGTDTVGIEAPAALADPAVVVAAGPAAGAHTDTGVADVAVDPAADTDLVAPVAPAPDAPTHDDPADATPAAVGDAQDAVPAPPVPPNGFVRAGGQPEIVFHGASDADELEALPIDGNAANVFPPVPEGYGLIDIEAPEASSDFDGPLLAKVLVDSGRVTSEQMMAALAAHQQTGESLARYLFNQGLATEDDLVWAMAQEVGLEFVDLNAVTVDRVAAALIPEATARHHMVLPIRVENGVPVVAMANPTDVFAMDDLRTIMGRNFTPVVATRSQIAHFLRYSHESEVDVSEVATDAEAGAFGGSQFELESLQAVVEDAPIVRYVNLLILQALNERASDIHIEPTPRRLRIRFRIDGVMHDATSASSSISSAVVSRLKVLGEMDITEHRVPQEGRVSLSVSDRQIDLRLAVLPSIYGETVVMRLLDKSASLRTLPELGFSSDTLGRYSKAYRQPYGVILVTGPTGAGKTTTLYATLAEVTSPEVSVVTVEDPVEYQIDGITQVQINPKAGLVFSNALKSILRSDPDIVLIGEIRDGDTAMIAMEAALSGHLVLTTLHTNTAAATPLRLTEMGIEPFLVTSALGSVLTQRLARVLCPNCKEEYEATEQDFIAAGYTVADLELVPSTTLHRAVGCRNCGHTGYQGRMVLSEVMNMSEEIDRMIIGQSSIVDIERKACEQGMRTLRQDGLLKAVSGLTTLEEVLRVVV